MIIKDLEKGMFEIKVDAKRKVIYEKNSGFWTKEDFKRYVKAYEDLDKQGILKKMGKWCKISDLTEYKTSSIADEINENVKWAVERGFVCAAAIVPASIIGMQMNRVTKGVIELINVSSMEEAEAWIKTRGF